MVLKKYFLFVLILAALFLYVGCSKKTQQEEVDHVQNQTQVEESEEISKTPEEIKEEFINDKISNMTIDQKIGQLFMVEYRTDSDGNNIIEINEQIKDSIIKYHLGGIILFAENIDTKEQTKTLIQEFQRASDIPLLIGIDEEGGRVSRLSKSGKMENTKVPTAGSIGEGEDTQVAYDMYHTIGKELKELGFNVDFAPIADINTNIENTVIGDRAFGSEPEKTADMVVMAVKGLQDTGVSAALKHFPGHGDTVTDTHTAEAIVNYDMDRLMSVEFVPFQKGIAAGVDFVMVGHIKVPSISKEDVPATMSPEVVEGIIRDKLNFKGIVITDALNMGAIAQFYDNEEVAIKAVKAGIDIQLMPVDLDAAFNAVKTSVERGDISQERIDESVKRIYNLKYDKGLLN